MTSDHGRCTQSLPQDSRSGKRKEYAIKAYKYQAIKIKQKLVINKINGICKSLKE